MDDQNAVPNQDRSRPTPPRIIGVPARRLERRLGPIWIGFFLGRRNVRIRKIASNGSRHSHFYGPPLRIAVEFYTASRQSKNMTKITILTPTAALERASLQKQALEPEVGSITEDVGGAHV
jgi:hypothetical protein